MVASFRAIQGKSFTFKMDVDLPRSGVDLVKRMHVKGDMKKSWIKFDHIERLRTRPP